MSRGRKSGTRAPSSGEETSLVSQSQGDKGNRRSLSKTLRVDYNTSVPLNTRDQAADSASTRTASVSQPDWAVHKGMLPKQSTPHDSAGIIQHEVLGAVTRSRINTVSSSGGTSWQRVDAQQYGLSQSSENSQTQPVMTPFRGRTMASGTKHFYMGSPKRTDDVVSISSDEEPTNKGRQVVQMGDFGANT